MSRYEQLPSEAEVGSLTCDYIDGSLASCSLYPANINAVKCHIEEKAYLSDFEMENLDFVEKYLYGEDFPKKIDSINEMCGDVIVWKVGAKQLLSSGNPLVSPSFTLKNCNHNFFIAIAEPLPDNDQFMMIIDDGTDGSGFAIYVDCLFNDTSVITARMEIGIELRAGGKLLAFNAQNFNFKHSHLSEQGNRMFMGHVPKFIHSKIKDTPLVVIAFVNHIFDEHEEIGDDIRFDYISSKSMVPVQSECEVILTPKRQQLMASSYSDNQVYIGGLTCSFAKGDMLWSFARVMDQVEGSDVFVMVFVLYAGEKDYKYLCCQKQKYMAIDNRNNMIRIPILSKCEGDLDSIKCKLILANFNRFGRVGCQLGSNELGSNELGSNDNNLVFTKVVDERDVISHFKMTKMSFGWRVFAAFKDVINDKDELKVVLKHKNVIDDGMFTNLVGIDFDIKAFEGAVTLQISDIYKGSDFVHQDDERHDKSNTTCIFDVGSGPFVTSVSPSFEFVVILHNPQ